MDKNQLVPADSLQDDIGVFRDAFAHIVAIATAAMPLTGEDVAMQAALQGIINLARGCQNRIDQYPQMGQ